MPVVTKTVASYEVGDDTFVVKQKFFYINTPPSVFELNIKRPAGSSNPQVLDGSYSVNWTVLTASDHSEIVNKCDIHSEIQEGCDNQELYSCVHVDVNAQANYAHPPVEDTKYTGLSVNWTRVPAI